MNQEHASQAILLGVLSLAVLIQNTADADWNKRGNIAIELQGFTDNALHTATQSSNASISGSAEFNHSHGDNGFFTISPFFRIDQHDAERSHVDLREFSYSYSKDDWEVNIGLGKVFWGVAESNNIVDVINQIDSVEGASSDNKLGQPMLNLLLLKDWGEISLFVLPGFRERTFAGQDGRPRGFFAVNTDNATYESSQGNKHIDLAARASGSVNEWDLGAHLFYGTSREPLISLSNGAPYYFQMAQIGFDAQATYDSWLLKTELIHRTSKSIDNHTQAVAGFEYSFYSVAESNLDIGVVSEWLYDSRQSNATTVFQNDLLIGLRFALNDEQSSQALLGVISDLDGGGDIINFEASRRIADEFKLTLEALIWSGTESDALLSQFGQEDYVQLKFGYFF